MCDWYYSSILLLCNISKFFRYDNSTREASLSVGLQGVEEGDVDMVKNIIWDTLDRVSR